MQLKNILIILIILIIIIVIIICCRNLVLKDKNIYESFNYHKCNDIKVGRILNDVFVTNNIQKSSDNWDIYLPCGYNYVERELKTIKPQNTNQVIFGVSGCDSIVSKNRLWELIKINYGRDKATKIMPETWVLNDSKDMRLFMRNYDENNMYILKKNVQRKEGLKLTKNFNEILEAKNENYKVVQKYEKNLYLINNRKVNLRVYLLIVCQKGNMTGYIHENGKCIYTNKEYNDNLFDFESNITSYHLDMDVYKQNPYSFKELKKYLSDDNKDYNLLFERINKIINLTMKSISGSLGNLKNIYNNKTFQLFGLDIIFDKNLNPYLLEINKGPDMIPRDDTDRKMKFKVENDIFNILNITKTNEKNGFYIVYVK
jgi:tubulin polyglutamylase TTLL6/13